MQWKAVRQLAKNGNSLTIAIPRTALHGMRLLRSDFVEIIYDDVEETLTMRAQERRAVAPDLPARSSEMVPVSR